MYRRYAERGEFVTRDGKKITDARTLAGQIGLAKTMRKYDLRRGLSPFTGRVEAAREFSDEMPDGGRVDATSARDPRGRFGVSMSRVR